MILTCVKKVYQHRVDKNVSLDLALEALKNDTSGGRAINMVTKPAAFAVAA